VTISVDMAQPHNFRHPCEREDLVPPHVGAARYPIGVGYDVVAESGMTQLHNYRHPCEREDLIPLHVVPTRYPIRVGYDEAAEPGMTGVVGMT
jgi:hypothetical protein